MYYVGHIFFLISLLSLGFNTHTFSQISPGELAKVHAHLEGMSNCTKCHTLGAKVSNEKCLACHTEIKERIDQQKGFHVSLEVKGKECASCHNDHHGKNFEIIRFDTTKFQHRITGLELEGAHSRQKCIACHTSKFISDKKLKSKPQTYLGLRPECTFCHSDYHQQTLIGSCSRCHGQNSFKPAEKFDHNTTDFPLIGKHQSVECDKCHEIETREGKSFQKFAGLKFENCSNCHADVHKNKYGQNCKQCHSESSFFDIKKIKNFDHSKTGFLLKGKHINVSCAACHKTNVSAPLKHKKCTDCHSDYHKGQFVKSGKLPDCNKCHTVNGFTPSLFFLENHNQSKFKLKGAHLAVACTECHKKQNKWSFRNIGLRCVDCHTNIHKSTIQQKYYPDENCIICHTENRWNEINFDHNKTNYQLTGAHSTTSCRACHYSIAKPGSEQQKFTGLAKTCISCHMDIHNKQFEKNGSTDCNECHDTDNWDASKFNHDNTAFKLEGKHKELACSKCHKLLIDEKFVKYKIKDFRCETCHL